MLLGGPLVQLRLARLPQFSNGSAGRPGQRHDHDDITLAMAAQACSTVRRARERDAGIGETAVGTAGGRGARGLLAGLESGGSVS